MGTFFLCAQSCCSCRRLNHFPKLPERLWQSFIRSHGLRNTKASTCLCSFICENTVFHNMVLLEHAAPKLSKLIDLQKHILSQHSKVLLVGFVFVLFASQNRHWKYCWFPNMNMENLKHKGNDAASNVDTNTMEQ